MWKLRYPRYPGKAGILKGEKYLELILKGKENKDK